MRVITGVHGLLAAKGEDLGPSEWAVIDQDKVNLFAEATDDSQWIHVDPERAASGPFGGTVVHGFLTLSLIPSFMRKVLRLDGFVMAVNYGLNKVRFVAPVRTGARVRAQITIQEVTVLEGAVQVEYRIVMEVEGTEKPACVADTVVRYYLSQG